jgi:peptide deformylase
MEVIQNNELLYEESKDVSLVELNEIKKLSSEMISLCLENGGIGLTAVQVGVTKKFFVANIRGIWQVFVNPKILSYGKKMNSIEGCLSFKGRKPIKKSRSKKIKVEYIDLAGNIVNKTFKELNAIVYQHEFDHTRGICCY